MRSDLLVRRFCIKTASADYSRAPHQGEMEREGVCVCERERERERGRGSSKSKTESYRRIIRRSFSTAFTWATFESIIHVFESLVGGRR